MNRSFTEHEQLVRAVQANRPRIDSRIASKFVLDIQGRLWVIDVRRGYELGEPALFAGAEHRDDYGRTLESIRLPWGCSVPLDTGDKSFAQLIAAMREMMAGQVESLGDE